MGEQKKSEKTKSSEDEVTLTATVPDGNQSGKTYTKVDISEKKPASNLDQTISEEFSGDDLTLSGIEKPDGEDFFSDQKRAKFKPRAPRFDLRLKVFIFSKNKTFKTHSNNISLSGMLLEEPVPRDCIENVFEIVIINGIDPNEKISFTGKLAGDVIDPRRVMFVEQKEQFKKNLEKLLRSYIDKMRK